MSSCPGEFVRSTQDIEKDFEDFKKCMISKLEIMAENHARDLQGLKDIIDVQRKEIKKLEAENALKNTARQELSQKLEDMSLQQNDVNENAGRSLSENNSRTSEKMFNKLHPCPPKTGLQSMEGNTSDGSKIAFFASVTNNLINLGENQNIVFDNAVTNIGNGYLPRHGIFVAPVTGTYVLSVTLMVSGSSKSWGHFVVNGLIIAKLVVDHRQSSQTIVVYLREGDDVSVQNTVPNREINGDRYSTFSGFLLYEDVTENENEDGTVNQDLG